MKRQLRIFIMVFVYLDHIFRFFSCKNKTFFGGFDKNNSQTFRHSRKQVIQNETSTIRDGSDFFRLCPNLNLMKSFSGIPPQPKKPRTKGQIILLCESFCAMSGRRFLHQTRASKIFLTSEKFVKYRKTLVKFSGKFCVISVDLDIWTKFSLKNHKINVSIKNFKFLTYLFCKYVETLQFTWCSEFKYFSGFKRTKWQPP